MNGALRIAAIAALALAFAVPAGAQRLTVPSYSPGAATLQLTGFSASWWYQRTSPTLGTCQGPATPVGHTTHASLTGLSPSTRYTVEAYSAAGCMAATRFATVKFRTLTRDWSAGKVVGASVVLVQIRDRQPRYRVRIHPSNELDVPFDCTTTYYIPDGNGDLSDPAQVMLHRKATEMLDVAKAAVILRLPVEVSVDQTTKQRGSNGEVLCALTTLSLMDPG